MLVLGGVTVALGAALGYFVIGGARQDHTVADTQGVQEASVPPPAAPAPPPHALVHVRPNSDYTAPGAPRIRIVEDRDPTLDSPNHRPATPTTPAQATTTDIPTPDVEASQQGTGDANAPSTPPPPTPNPSPVDPATPSTDSTTDPEASQTGTPPSGQRAQYRVQAGSFGSAQDAQDYVNTLQGQGLAASVSPQRQGGQTVYKVQVGAYHDRDSAEQAASGLRRQGVPVTVAPINP